MSVEELELSSSMLLALKKARLSQLAELLLVPPFELEHRLRSSAADINKLLSAAAARVCQRRLVSALSLKSAIDNIAAVDGVTKLTTGCDIINNMLHGGISNRGITEVCGESASGKTQFCLQLSLTVQLPRGLGGLGGGVAYVCTEDAFPSKRLMQMVTLLRRRCAESPVAKIDFGSGVFVEHAAELDDLDRCVCERLPVLLGRHNVKLIVIDSIAAVFRAEFSVSESRERAKRLNAVGGRLRALADNHNIPVVCINQVTGNISRTSHADKDSIPALGIAWANWVTTSIMLQRTTRVLTQTDSAAASNGCNELVVRKMDILFAPHLPRASCHFIVDADGMKGLK